ncbi:MAG: hypothetical protein KatS3mg121_1054 [Gammaproteobacteria bacterium]|nr:MAG: hypothetical protein KatS3mg121_1054 [Gammaproteobacteria bacterium]
MRNRGGRRQFESALYFLIACLAMAMFYLWVERLARPVEDRRVEYTLAQIGAALRVAELTAVAAGRVEALAGLAGADPMALFDPPPADYAGRLEAAVCPAPRRWYYRPAEGTLWYCPAAGRPPRRWRLVFRPAGPPHLRLEALEEGGG